jgi:hypothetical protein
MGFKYNKFGSNLIIIEIVLYKRITTWIFILYDIPKNSKFGIICPYLIDLATFVRKSGTTIGTYFILTQESKMAAVPKDKVNFLNKSLIST